MSTVATQTAKQQKRLLVVTEDEYFKSIVVDAIETLPLCVSWALPHDALRKMSLGEFDALFFDRCPQLSSLLEAAERLEARSARTPTKVLVRTTHTGLATLRFPARLCGDFVVEGASSEELTLRLRFLLFSQESLSARETLFDGSLEIDTATYQVKVNGEPLDLAYLEYALLAFLVSHPNRAYSRDELLRRVWGGQYFGGSRTVDVHVRRVRAKLDSSSAQRLETVRGMGYLWRTS